MVIGPQLPSREAYRSPEEDDGMGIQGQKDDGARAVLWKTSGVNWYDFGLHQLDMRKRTWI